MKTSGRKGKGWMDHEILNTVRKKHKLFRRWVPKRGGQDYFDYVRAGNQESSPIVKKRNNLRPP